MVLIQKVILKPINYDSFWEMFIWGLKEFSRKYTEQKKKGIILVM